MAEARHGMTSRGSYNIGIRMEGQWMKLNQIVNTMAPAVVAAAVESQKQFAKKYQRAVVKNIRNGGRRFNYAGHSESYSKFKKAHGGPSKLLMWGGTMAESVVIQKAGLGRFAVTIDPEATRMTYPGESGKNKLRVSEYANILEHGTANMKPRPVFGDTFKDMGGIRGMQRYMQWNFARKFKSVTITI